MKECEECSSARLNPHRRVFSLGCPWCAARNLRLIQSFQIPAQEKKERMQSCITDYTSRFQDEALIRKLYQQREILEPIKPASESESAPQKPVKRRSVR